jgi:TRAP-type uncharacterized transport system substrate-binding protein
MKQSWVFLFLLYISFFKQTVYSQENKTDFIIATGSRGGNYYKTGEYIAKQYNTTFSKSKFSIIETNGSNENIELLKNNSVDFAIVQRNILINNIYDEDDGTKNIAVITPLFQEKLWIYFNGKKPLNIRKIDSLSSVNKLRIGFTSKTGYSYNFFKTVLKFLNIDRTRLIESENNYNSLISSFQNNEIDAVVSFSLPLMAFDTLPQSQKMFLSKDDAFLIEKRVHNVFASTINNTINQYSLGSWSFLIGTKKKYQYISN